MLPSYQFSPQLAKDATSSKYVEAFCRSLKLSRATSQHAGLPDPIVPQLSAAHMRRKVAPGSRKMASHLESLNPRATSAMGVAPGGTLAEQVENPVGSESLVAPAEVTVALEAVGWEARAVEREMPA
eukprot:CAMPEP_0181187750 /NCGR_PEP_ID=MMETSP1096-20121128/10744_1 /TAXON_ID=156174 ORGANISM="Chrysochromulina ericina, Strain CCMP281" /NCGR_SAMPLE_ID=MMETSP1096 /ASSEMBLY_ACC=CAM_ASM_000453 /LENGTH=126 /DNA_ID=CAMNT_0023276755 /DNA_START=850 /DNA_END=1231 /DNA_ORIENTATION=-